MLNKTIKQPTPGPIPSPFPKPSNYNVIDGTDQNDTIHGTDGHDIIRGWGGHDKLYAEKGGDALYGGTGDDSYYLTDAGATASEYANEGHDTVYTPFDHTLGANFEDLVLTGSDPVNGTGNELSNIIWGNSGNNILIGLAGEDKLNGGAGADTMIGGLDNDTYWVDNVGDVIVELSGEGLHDNVVSTVSYTIGPNVDVENLYLQSGAGAIDGTGNDLDNMISGNESDNILTGGGGKDTFYGSQLGIPGGKDTMYGGADDDTFMADSSDDVVVEYAGEGHDVVVATASYVLPDNVEDLYLNSPGPIDGTGNEQANVIAAPVGASQNVLLGLGGNDTMYAYGGNDTLDGGAGDDWLYGGPGEDTFHFAPGFGHDHLADFQAGYMPPPPKGDPQIGEHDVLELDSSVFASFAAVQAAMAQVGNDTVITSDADNTITLYGVNMSELQAANFHFV